MEDILYINNIIYEVYETYLSQIDAKGSIGYNINSKEYYGLDNNYKLITYKPYVLKKKKGEI